MSALPRSWTKATLASIFTLVRGLTYAKEDVALEQREAFIPLLRANNIQNGKVGLDDLIYLPMAIVKDVQIVRDGDIIMATSSGSKTVVGKAAMVPEVDGGVTFGAFCGVLRPRYKGAERYAFQYFRSRAYREYVEAVAIGTNINNFRSSDILGMGIPLPPLSEQKRILAKLDALSAKSARARTELSRIETLVSRYKQALLSKAFSGELTAAGALEPEYRGATSTMAPRYPAHWKVMPLGGIAEIKSGITLGKKRNPDEPLMELPYLRVANVQRGWLNLDQIKTVQVTAKEAEALYLRKDDVLMNEGGDRDKLGRGWVWDGQLPNCIHQNHVFRVRLARGSVPSRFLSYYTNEFGQKHFFDEGKQTTNLASISKSKLSGMQIPVPPFDEATEIVRCIESAYSKIDRLAIEAKRALTLLGRLDEAILAKAFRGELVPQDEADEPAVKLLERIRAEREAAPKATRRKQSASSTLDSKRRKTEMAKTRGDVEKDHLAKILRDNGSTKSPTDLWLQSGMEIDEFYKQLRAEIDSGQIREGANKDQLVLTDAR